MKPKLSAALKSKKIEAIMDEEFRLIDRLRLNSVTVAAKKIYFQELQKYSKQYKDVILSVTPEEAPLMQKILDDAATKGMKIIVSV